MLYYPPTYLAIVMLPTYLLISFCEVLPADAINAWNSK